MSDTLDLLPFDATIEEYPPYPQELEPLPNDPEALAAAQPMQLEPELPSIADFDPEAAGAAVQQQTVVLEMHVRSPGYSTKLSAKDFISRARSAAEQGNVGLAEQIAEGAAGIAEQTLTDAGNNGNGTADALPLDPKWVSVSQSLLDRKALRDLSHLDGKMHGWIRARAVNCKMLAWGLYLMPLELVEQVDERIRRYEQERLVLIDALESRYEDLKADARTRRGPFYRDEDYPPFPLLRLRYKVEARWLSFNVPAALERMNRELFERERAKVQLQWQEAAEDVRDALRAQFVGMVNHLAERLGTDEEGKKKVFHRTAVEKFQEFLALFDARNLTSDDELAALARQARELLTGVDARALRRDDALRSALETGFAQIKEQTAGMVTTQHRRFAVDDEEMTLLMADAVEEGATV